jgi:hypothetical protein
MNRFSAKDAKALDRIESDKYFAVSINPAYYQQSSISSVIDTLPSMSFEYMRQVKQYALSKHLNVIIKPLIDARSGSPRTYFSPKDIDRWFEDYTKIYLRLLENIDSTKNIDMVVGTELDSILSKYPERFNRLIDTIKAAGYSGKIIYSAAFSSELDTVKILQMNDLKTDDNGIDFYVSMHKYNSKKYDRRPIIGPDGKIIQQEYAVNEGPYEFIYYFDKIFAATKKPVIFTEVGFRSVEHGNRWPFYDYLAQGAPDNAIQKTCYQNFLEALKLASNMRRYDIPTVYFWVTDNSDFWQSVFHADSTGFSTFRKPAERAIYNYNKDINER